LRESEERFRTLANDSPVMIWVNNQNGDVEFVNRAWSEFFGSETPGKDWRALFHPDDLPAYESAYRAAMQERKPFRGQGGRGAPTASGAGYNPTACRGSLRRATSPEWSAAAPTSPSRRRPRRRFARPSGFAKSFSPSRPTSCGPPSRLCSCRSTACAACSSAVPSPAPNGCGGKSRSRRAKGRLASLIDGLLNVSRSPTGGYGWRWTTFTMKLPRQLSDQQAGD